MSFEVFTEHAVKVEVLQMLHELKDADYAISTLTKEEIQHWANECKTPVVLRKLLYGKVKVKLSKTEDLGPVSSKCHDANVYILKGYTRCVACNEVCEVVKQTSLI